LKRVYVAFTPSGAKLVRTLLDTYLDAMNEAGNKLEAKRAQRALSDVCAVTLIGRNR
jgi:hypothetical protein